MPNRLSMQARVAFAVTAAIVPAALIAAALVGYDYYERERSRVIRDTTGTARALVAGVDGELEAVRAALLALRTSPHLAVDDLAAFHAQATAALKDQDFVSVVLLDGAGVQRMNTLRPFGAALPASGNPDALVRIASSGQPAVTDLFRGPLGERWFVAVGVPVIRNGAARYSLNAGILPERLGEVLTRQHLPPDWVAAIFDSTGTVVARTHLPDRFVGGKGAATLLQRMKETLEGSVQTDTLEGTPVVSVFSRSAESGWTVAIGIPEAELLRHLLFSMARLAIVAFVLLGAALGLAVWIGGRLSTEAPSRR
jgi:hypothetical protein